MLEYPRVSVSFKDFRNKYDNSQLLKVVVVFS